MSEGELYKKIISVKKNVGIPIYTLKGEILLDTEKLEEILGEAKKEFAQLHCKGNCSETLGYKGDQGSECMAECGCPGDLTWFRKWFGESK